MLSFGNTSIKDVYFGSTKIKEMYLGSSKVYSSSSSLPYLIFEFSELNFIPTNSLLSSDYNNYATWTQVSTYPYNMWKLEISQWVVTQQEQAGRGLPFLFCNPSGANNGYLIPENLNNGYCILIESGNFDVQLNGYYCDSLDRMFANCTGLIELSNIIRCTTVNNVGGMFIGCTEINTGALVQYNWFNTYGVNITNHSGTFTNCGENTQTGRAELEQIPVGWGGNLIPASTLMTSTRQAYNSNRYTAWKIISPGIPDWTNIIGMYLFTQYSVAQYAGVSMNRTRIPNPLNGLGTAQANYALYFYPAFVQCTKIPGQSGNTVSWVATTDNPNSHLDVGQANTDMPGTLDYSTYGPFTREYGTYDSTKDVYFVFLVTNVPIAQWGGLTDAMGFLYSQYYNSDAGLRYFF